MYHFRYSFSCFHLKFDVTLTHVNTYLISSLNVKIICFLKRLEITKEERDKARKKYEPEREKVKESVAFGRRADGPPKRVYAPPPSATFESLGFDQGR